MKLRPLGDRVVVRCDEPQAKSKGGILIPEKAQEKPRKGEVLAVGPGRFCPELLSKVEATADLRGNAYAPMSVKVGDVVLFSQWSGNEHKDLGEGVLILSEGDILGVVEK
jgi:chaperonin GroES